MDHHESKQAFYAGADETGAVVLHVIGDSGRAVPVSEQCGTWREWTDALDRMGAAPGALIPVVLVPAEETVIA